MERPMSETFNFGDLIDNPRPVQLATFLPTGPNGRKEFHYHTSLLKTILENERYANKKLIVISNAGNAGKGKTLKQNYFIEWLYLLESIQPTTNNVSLLANKQRSDLMAAPRGFIFRSSQQSTTNGIWIWSRPFLLVDADGTETVVIVLDAQGTNAPGQNGEWDVQIDAQIFTTTSLISSIQLFHMADETENINSLVRFTKYALICRPNDPEFQTLWFIVRDFNKPPGAGFEAGEQILDVLKTNPKYSSILARNHVQCYALPKPGPAVEDYECEEQFKNNLCTVDEIDGRKGFLEHLEKMFSAMIPITRGRISTNVLKGKTMVNLDGTLSNTRTFTCRETCTQILNVFKTFKNTKFVDPDDFPSQWACIIARDFASKHMGILVDNIKLEIKEAKYRHELRELNKAMNVVINQALGAYKMAHWHVSKNIGVKKLEHFISEGEGLFNEFKKHYTTLQNDNARKPDRPFWCKNEDQCYGAGLGIGGLTGGLGGLAGIYGFAVSAAVANPVTAVLGLAGIGIVVGIGIVWICLEHKYDSVTFGDDAVRMFREIKYLEELFGYEIALEQNTIKVYKKKGTGREEVKQFKLPENADLNELPVPNVNN